MNAHHKKSSFRPPAPRNPQHFSSSTSKVSNSSPSPTQLRKAIERVPFGWQLDVVVPEVGNTTSSPLVEALKREIERDTAYQVVRSVNLADLLEPTFLNSFIRNGSLVAISVGASETDDVVTIDGRGRLILSVCKDTYEILGLPGRASLRGAYRQRFIVEISLVDAAFRSGKPGYERVKRLLQAWPQETELFEQLQSNDAKRGTRTFDLVVSYVDEQGQPKLVEFPSSITPAARRADISTRNFTDIAVPSPSALPPPAPDSTRAPKRQRTSSGALRRSVREDELWWDSFKEWRGLAALGAIEEIKWRSVPEDDDWGVSNEDCEKGSVTALSVNGLLHPRTLGKIVEKTLSNPLFAAVPYLSLMLRPLPHSPISHISAASPPVVGTSIRPNGKKRKRGRGRGEEEEADPDRGTDVGGWEIVCKPTGDECVNWWMWEGQ